MVPRVQDWSIHLDQHKPAVLTIWLGILLDGIPESLVIGASVVETHISLSLLVGLFVCSEQINCPGL
jgi:hypothetical protein